MSKKKEEKIEIFYDVNGESVLEEDRAIVCAKYERLPISGNKQMLDVFWVLLDPTGNVYNKNGGMSMTRLNKDRFRFRKVGQDCFEKYLDFLKTGNQATWSYVNRKASE